ncbi:MAG: glycosyltransferase [Deltaproteobacteria bacterium]|nr:glycosyltransferase [Deltaproteobacteria bacterium]
MKIGIWCDFGFTLRPSEGIGVFVAQLLRGLSQQPQPPQVALVLNGNDRKIHHELLAYTQGLNVEVIVPPIGVLQKLRILYRQTIAKWLLRTSKYLLRLEHWMRPRLPRALLAKILSHLGEIGSAKIIKLLAIAMLSPLLLTDILITIAYLTFKHLVRLGPVWVNAIWKALRESLFGGEYAYIFRLARNTVCDVWFLPYPGLPVKPDLRAPLLLVVHDIVYRYYPEGYDPVQNAELFKLTEEIASEAKITACLSETVRENDLINELQIERSKTAVIPHAVPNDIVEQKYSSFKDLQQRYHIPENFFFYPSAFRPYKNHALAVRALAILINEQQQNVGLVFTGIQGMPPRLQTLLDDSEIGDHVFILGRVSREDIAGLYRSAKALVFPSLHEGFGFPPLEALALGCPVVCSDIPVLREVVGSYKEVVQLVNPYSAKALAKALKIILNAREQYSQVLATTRKLVLSRNWQQVANEWLRLCTQAINN